MEAIAPLDPGLGAPFGTAPTLAVAPEDQPAFAGLPVPEGVVLLPCRAADDGVVAGGSGQVLTRPPLNLLGLVAASDSGEATLAAVRARLAADFAMEIAAPVRLAQPIDPAALLGHALSALAARQAETVTRNVRLMQDLAELRRCHEETQAAFRALEAFLDATDLAERVQDLCLDPAGPVLELRPGARLAQRLPVSSVGLSDVALHVAEAPRDPDGVLAVVLKTAEDGAARARWSVPVAEQGPGWLRLGLGHCLGPDAMSVELAAEWRGSGDLALSLGMAHPEPRWCADVDGDVRDRVLALRAWRGVPGTRARLAGAPPEGRAAPRRRSIGAEALERVEPRAGTAEQVRHVPERGGVLVHPSGTGPAVARLPRALPRGARHVRAEIRTDHAQAGEVEYSLAAALPPGARGAAPDVLSSEWVRLPAATTGEVHLVLPRALPGPGDLYLATRMAQGQPSEYAWAFFRRLRIEDAAPGECEGRAEATA